MVEISHKPTLPLNWALSDGNTISDFLERRNFTEIYKLSSGQFLYLFQDQKVQSKIKSRLIDNEIITISGRELPAIRFITHSHAELSQRINRIINKTGLEAVAGMEELKQIIVRDVIHPFLNREEYEKYRLGIPNGILLFGPPGCGKTYITKKIAEELSIPMIELRESDVGSPYIHATSGNIAKAFKEAERIAPCIVFIDEVSGIIPKRDGLSGSNQYRESEINEFLMQIEGAGEKEILVIGATNFPERIDAAAMRSGRMDKRIFIPPPDYYARIELFKMELEDRPIDQGITLELLSKFSEGFVASDIKLTVDNAARKALSLGSSISMEILRDVLNSTTPSLTDKDIVLYSNFKDLERK